VVGRVLAQDAAHQGALAAERQAEREHEVLAEPPRVAHGGCSCSVRDTSRAPRAAVKLLGLSLMLLASPAAADCRPSAITGEVT
jgi:MYXO-CTERM domain-containing protein